MKPKDFYYSISTVKSLLKKSISRKFKIKFKDSLRCWKDGFLPESFVLYNNPNKSLFLSDYYRIRYASQINGRYKILLDDKILFQDYFKDNERVVKAILSNVQKTVLDVNKNKIKNVDEFQRYLAEGEFVIKPSTNGGGNGISFFSIYNNEVILNGEQSTIENVWEEFIRYKHSIINSKITQNGFFNLVAPQSVNTIRLLTMFDVTEKKSFLAHAVFRCGTKASGNVDNFTNGGLSIYIDKSRGILGKGVSFPKDGILKWHSSHPDSNVLFEGLSILGWDSIVKDILNMSDKIPFAPYIGWDIIPLDNGYLILEANGNSDVNLLQVHEPLLKNQKVKQFYERYGSL